jgi:ribosomal-protein-alanine N-acetyltransferase
VVALRLEGPRLLLRDLDPGDLDATLAIVGDPEVTRTLSFDARTREEQAVRLADDVARGRTRPRTEYYMGAIARDTGVMVGFARLALLGHRAAEVGYAIRRDHWGRGFATEATGVLVDFGFGELALHRVQGACGPDNEASRRVMERLGFRYEGRLRHHVFTNGDWRDSLLFAVLEHEWRGPRPLADRIP